jgi:hypothetical protein
VCRGEIRELACSQPSHFLDAGCAADVWCATEQIDEDGWVLEATGAEVVEKGEWYYKADLPVVHRDYNTTAQDIIVQVHTLSHQILEKMKHGDAFHCSPARQLPNPQS